MNQVLLILFLLSVLESHGIAVSDTSFGSTILPLVDRNNSGSLIKRESSTEVVNVTHEEDPIDSAETVVYTKFAKPTNNEDKAVSEEEEDSEGPPDHVIPRSDHEEARNVPTKPKYIAPGEWAKPKGNKEVELDFVPSKVYAQVRRTHTLRRLPRKKAIENAESEEEKENAARLREVVKNTKVNTVYTEEGYEDSAYDHAGQIRDADFHEGFARKLHDQLDLKDKSKNVDGVDYDEGENETKQKSYKKIRPEEFKDYNEDYSDPHETNTDMSNNVQGGKEWKVEAYPKLIAEEGIETLQDDLEKEDEEMEKGMEISKLEKAETTTEIIAESQNFNDYDKVKDLRWRRARGKKRPSSSKRNGKYSSGNSKEYEGGFKNGESGREAGRSSPNVDSVDFQRAEENPTTISYSQLFWDYFKRRQNLLSTTQPPTEFTTLNPYFLRNVSSVENSQTITPYPIYGQEATTSFPLIETATIIPQQIVRSDQTLLQPAYIEDTVQNSPISDNVQMSGNHNSERNDNLFNPFNRKPRYKITIRQKHDNRPTGSLEFSNNEPITSTPINERLIESITPESISVHENYMKVLKHLQNENKVKNYYHPNSLQQTSFYPQNSKNEIEDLTRLRPPLPQKTNDYYYYNVGLNRQSEKEFSKPDWKQLSAPQRAQQSISTNSRKQSIPSDSFHPKQTHPKPSFNRKRPNYPPFEFIQPSLMRNELIRHKESADYVNGRGNRSKQNRNHLRPLRQIVPFKLDAIRGGIRVKRRERRSVAGQMNSDENVVKGSMAKNGVSNRDEIERTAKNFAAERNCSQKAIRVEEVGLVPDTSLREKRAGEKKSSLNDRGEGSRAVERESNAEGRNIDGRLGSFEYDGEEKRGRDKIESTRMRRTVERTKPELNDKSERIEQPRNSDLQNEHDNDDKRKVISIALTRVDKSNQDADSKIKDKLEEHAKLLNEAPKLTEDIVQKEIQAHFDDNEEQNENEETKEKKVEVEVPEFDYVEEIIEDDGQAEENIVTTTEENLDLQKYPFYNENLPMPSALKYAIDPSRLPRKTYGSMEFYNSRDAYRHCDDVEPNLEVLPQKEEPESEKGPNGNLPRLQGLGDKLDCFKAKYFDSNPFDNPLFLEKEVEEPKAPSSLDTRQFASRIMMFPKENDDFVIQRASRRPENYRQSRKPIAVRLQNTQRVRYKSYPRSRTRTSVRPRKRPIVYQIQVPQVKNTKNFRKPQVDANIATSASEVSSFYLPYQNQVYEDVMGTIKNLANSYQVYEITTTPMTEETTMMNEYDEEVTTKSFNNSTNLGKKDKNKVQIDIMDQPSNVAINIEELTRAKNRNRHRPIYKRTRRPQRNKPMVYMMQTPIVGHRNVKPRQRIRVYKRDLTDIDDSREQKTSEETYSAENSKEEIKEHDNLGERNNQRVNSENIKHSDFSTGQINISIKNNNNIPMQEVSNHSDPTSKTVKRKVKILKSVRRIDTADNDAEQKNAKPEKVVYTIKDRIRYSKPKPELRKVGKFVNDSEADEDGRRREPKYNYIKRKNSRQPVSFTTEASFDITNKDSGTETTVSTLIEQNNQDFKKDNQELQYLIDESKNQNTNASDRIGYIKEGTIQKPKEETTNKTSTGYAVYENVNEGDVTTTLKPESATPSEFFNLKTFLQIDSPGYMQLSSENFKNSFFPLRNETNDFKINLDTLNVNETENEKDDTSSKSYRPLYFSEESSEKSETKAEVESSTESSEESSAPSKEVSEEDRTFFTFTSRPYSPPENYEDPKYADLGPRINKPGFFHPPFSTYRKSRSRGSSEELVASDERKEEYVFPWQRDKLDQRKKRRHRGKSTGEYEYPWERRERLAREERKRKEERRKRLGFDDDDEAEETLAVKQQTSLHPRGRYRYWSRKDRDAQEDNNHDNTENSSEFRPTMKYSSRYNSADNKPPLTNKAINARSKAVEEISKSIKKALEGDSVEKETSKEKEDDSSWERRRSFSYKPRSISKGIAPEDITLAPTRKTGKRGKSRVNDSSDTSGKNRSSHSKNSIDNSEHQTTTTKTDPREIDNSTNRSNSTRQLSKKKRKLSNNSASTVESIIEVVTEANRGRRKHKSSSTTPSSVINTTSASRMIRRRNQKSLNDSKKNNVLKTPNISNNDASSTIEMTKSGTVEQRPRTKKKNRTNEILNEQTKNQEERELSTESPKKKQEHSEKVNDEHEKTIGDETEEKRSFDENVDRSDEEIVKSEERYDYKDDKVASNDFDRTYDDEDYDSGSVIEADTNLTPQNGALQQSEQSSRELVTSVSWISENYDF